MADTCRICGKLADNGPLCPPCWEVTHRLDAFLDRGGDHARAALKEALRRHLERRPPIKVRVRAPKVEQPWVYHSPRQFEPEPESLADLIGDDLPDGAYHALRHELGEDF